MTNSTPDQSGAIGAQGTDNAGGSQSQAQNVTPNNDAANNNPPPSGNSEVPEVSRQRSRGLSSTRISERIRAVRSGAGGVDRSTSTVLPRRARRGSDLAEDVVDHRAGSSSEGDGFKGGRSNTVSARNHLPKPGDLRRSETRAREEEWFRTVVSPVERTVQEGNTDRVGDLPSFQRSSTNNFGGEIGSLRRRGTALTTGRPRGDSVRSRISIVPPSRPGEAGPDPTFSLAGPGDPIAANLPFVERGYAVLNPAYDQPVNQRPVWGLAKPLPRVVRPGMVPSLSELNVNQQPDLEAGEAPRKAARAWDLALAAARAKSSKLQPSNEGDEDGNQLGKPSSVSQGTEPVMEGSTPPIPENPYEDEAEPFPNVATSPTEVHDEEDYNDMLGLTFGDEVHNNHTQWSVIRTKYREELAELLAVTVQLTLGFCADLAATASGTTDGTTAWAWGLATMVGIYIAGGISGAHLNPAISIMLWIYRGFPLRKVPSYLLAQVLGGFIAAFISFGIYRDAIVNYDGGKSLTAGGTAADIVTFPRYDYISIPTAFFNEFVGTAILSVAVMALGDDSNAPPGAGMNAFILGLIVTVNSMAFSHNTGAACNPSRDFGPRLALLTLGYGKTLFTNPYWFYGPWVACITGAIFGAGMYDIAIFTGGESPINYPGHKMKRAARKWRGRMRERVRRVPRRWRRRSDGYQETVEK